MSSSIIPMAEKYVLLIREDSYNTKLISLYQIVGAISIWRTVFCNNAKNIPNMMRSYWSDIGDIETTLSLIGEDLDIHNMISLVLDYELPIETVYL